MTADDAERQMKLATQSATDQREANRAMVEGALDAADRIIMRKAADATIQLATLPASDPK